MARKCFPHYWPFMRGIYRSWIPSQRVNLWYFLWCQLNKLSKKPSSCRWFKTTWRSFDVSAISCKYTISCQNWSVIGPKFSASSQILPVSDLYIACYQLTNIKKISAGKLIICWWGMTNSWKTIKTQVLLNRNIWTFAAKFSGRILLKRENGIHYLQNYCLRTMNEIGICTD